jgi:hypothetical protein
MSQICQGDPPVMLGMPGKAFLVASLCTGCVLNLPQGRVLPRPGQVIQGVPFDLDELSVIFADLCVRHAALCPAPGKGCAWAARGSACPMKRASC